MQEIELDSEFEKVIIFLESLMLHHANLDEISKTFSQWLEIPQRYMFSLNKNTQLSEGKASDELRKVFCNYSVYLSDKAQISRKDEKTWIIKDSTCSLTIKDINSTLDVNKELDTTEIREKIHSWMVAVLEGRVPINYKHNNFEKKQELAVLFSYSLWSQDVYDALQEFVIDSFQKERLSPKCGNYNWFSGRIESLAFRQMLRANVNSNELEHLASMLWELDSNNINNFRLDINGEFTHILVAQKWCFPHLLWEIWRQSLQRRGLHQWLDTNEELESSFWNAFSRKDAIPFFDLYDLINKLAKSDYNESEWETYGELERLKSLLESHSNVLLRALPIMLVVHGNNSSLLLTLTTLGYTNDILKKLNDICELHRNSPLGDISQALISEIRGKPSESQEKWMAYKHNDIKCCLTPTFSQLYSRTWLSDVRAEVPICSVFSKTEENFNNWILNNYALNERVITRRLLDLLCEETKKAELMLNAWAREKKQRFNLQLKVVEHEPYRMEKRSGADIGLVLEINAYGLMESRRACIIQAKKQSVVNETPKPKWTIERTQLEKLINFGDGALYWLYGLGPGVLVVPARVIIGMLKGKKKSSLNFSELVSSSHSITDFLVYDFIAGWIGEISPDKVDMALGEKTPGIGPDFILKIIITVGQGE